MSEDHMLSTSERVYKVLLLMYPKKFRESYGSHMTQAFGDLRREEMARTGGLAALWVRTLVDLLSSALAERSKIGVPLFSSPRLVRFGGLAAMVGGTILALLGLWRVYYWSQMPYGSLSVLYVEEALDLLGTSASLLILAGMLGLYASLPRGCRRLATVGVVVACLATMTLGVANVYEFLVVFSSGYPAGAIIPPGVFEVGGPVKLVGLLLLGVALLRAQTLGRWSALPLILGPLPLMAVPFAFLVSSGQPEGSVSEPGFLLDLSFMLPSVLADLGWVLLGYLLVRKNRDARPLDRNYVNPGPAPGHGSP